MIKIDANKECDIIREVLNDIENQYRFAHQHQKRSDVHFAQSSLNRIQLGLQEQQNAVNELVKCLDEIKWQLEDDGRLFNWAHKLTYKYKQQ